MSDSLPYAAACLLLVLLAVLGFFIVRSLRKGESSSAEAGPVERQAGNKMLA